jgi:MFS transporter, FHS family, L-fucose permease
MPTMQTNTGDVKSTSDKFIPTNYGALSTLVTVFFFWGFIAAGNSVFIPFCKHKFDLDQFQSQLVDTAFYFAYFVGALVIFAIGALKGSDPVAKWGYKKGIVYGLLFSAFGAAVMILTVNLGSFPGMLAGLFIVALGFSLQQTAAQPFAIALGDPSTGTSRVTLGGAINSFGTTIGPLVVGLALFGTTAAITDEKIASLSLGSVILLYSCVGLLFIAAAIMFYTSKKVPSGITIEKTDKASKALGMLLVMTGLLAVMFVPVFSSYTSKDQKQIEAIGKKIGAEKSAVDSIIKTTLVNPNDSAFAKGFLNDKKDEVLSAQMDSLSKIPTIATSIGAVKNIQGNIKIEDDQIKALKYPLEQSRMLWLFGAFAVVLASLIYTNVSAKKNATGWGAMQYPQLLLGMLGIFFYVGVEVTVGSNLTELLKYPLFGSLSSSEATPYVAMYWGSLMIGRWAGAVGAFGFSTQKRIILQIIVPIVAFIILIAVNSAFGYNMQKLYWYAACVFIQIGAFFISNEKPARTLLIFSLLGVAAMVIGTLTTGTVSIYAFLAGGLACSIMWPCIFSLSVAGLGKWTTQGSAFLIMMILGGGIIPPIQGKFADYLQAGSTVPGSGIHASYWIAAACYAYLAFFAYAVKGILKNQGINYDAETTAAGH